MYYQSRSSSTHHITDLESKGGNTQARYSTSSTATNTQTTRDTTTLHFLYPCNCSYGLSWAWPTYDTLAALKSASLLIVVAQVTSARTVGVNVSDYLGSPSGTSPIPVTDYSVTVTAVLSGSPSLGPGYTLSLAQIGGTANGTTMGIAGYPTLSVGQSYVFLGFPGVLE